MLFVSRRQRRSRRAEALVAGALERAERRAGVRLRRVELEERPDLFVRYRVAAAPALVLVEDRRIRGRIDPTHGADVIDDLLAPWLDSPAAA
jgi:hypothetical protein